MFSFDEVKNADAEVFAAMEDEMGRQRSHLELIASENLVSKSVMAAMGMEAILQINMQKDIRVRDIMAAVNM